MAPTTHAERDEWQSLTARDRSLLTALDREPLPYGHGRNAPESHRVLVGQGLAFRSHTGLSITDKGRAVLERVG